jgi:hypothetical protein
MHLDEATRTALEQDLITLLHVSPGSASEDANLP